MGWKWDHLNKDDKLLLVERNVARDKNLFRTPADISDPQVGMLHNYEVCTEVVTWQWPGDDRVFLIPIELFDHAKFGGLTRDIISFLGQLFRDSRYPENMMVTASLRQIAGGIGLSWNGGRVGEQIEKVLAFARCLTVNNYQIIEELNKNYTVKKERRETFGFVDRVSRIAIDNSMPVPRNKQKYEIYLSRLYSYALRNLPPAPLPAKALEVAHSAPWRIQGAVKNIAYYLAGRVPQNEVRLLLPTAREICGFAERSDGKVARTQKSIEHVLSVLSPTMISDYQYDTAGYNILLSGKTTKK
jgi:hypothetical protein